MVKLHPFVPEATMSDTTAVTAPGAVISRTASLMAKLRSSKIYRELIPMEAQLSWPVPFVAGNQVGAHFLCFSLARSTALERLLLFAPVAGITVNWKHGRIVEYRDYQFRGPWQSRDFAKPVGEFVLETFASREEYIEASSELGYMYDEFFDTLTHADGALPPYRLNAFGERLRRLIPEPLIPFYQAIAPKFCEQLLGLNNERK